MQMVKVLAVFAVFVFIAVPVWADWDPSQPTKWAQLPDPTGWDVDVTTDFVYDDWQCWGSGPITDAHFWYSWRGDLIGEIQDVIIEIWDDVPANTGTNLLPYSHPGQQLWSRTFFPGEFTTRPAGSGDQGWLAPSFTVPQWNRPDHQEFFQLNIPKILDPFIQTEGEIYWVGLHIEVLQPEPGMPQPMAGWKTSLDHWNDDATYYYTIEGIPPPYWNELIDPVDGVSLDMAFVLTVPEPASVVLLMLGSMGALAISRRMNS